MSKWGHVFRRGATLAVAVAALAGVEPSSAAVGPSTSNTITEFREVVRQGDYSAEGTGMLGTGAGTIVIADARQPATVTEAYLYWVIVAPSEGADFDNGTFNGVPIDGDLIAIGDDPCRDPDPFDAGNWSSFVYRADVTSLVTPVGDGTYVLAGFATGTIDPLGDPFGTTSTAPSNAGATLVVLYESPTVESRVVTLYDGAAVVDDPFESAMTTLRFASTLTGQARTTYGVAEGQNQFSDETVFNGVVLARNEAFNEQSFSGSDGLNQDTDTYDVTPLVQPGDTSAVVSIGNGDDCLVHYVQVFSAPSATVAPEPALLTLTPETAAVQIGEPHTVTATVTTATGEPVPDVLVHFDVTGSVETTGSCVTDVNGQCTFTFAGPDLPGAVTITAYADVDRDNVRDPLEPSGAATAVFVVPSSTPLCDVKITYGGWIIAANTDRGSFGGNAKADENRGTTGQAEYQDHGPVQELNVHGDVVAVVCNPDGRTGTIFGRGTVNGAGSVDFRIDVVDVAEPGTGSDHYRIRFGTYESGDRVLSGGNIQVHKG